jgi:hypothetical protein
MNWRYEIGIAQSYAGEGLEQTVSVLYNVAKATGNVMHIELLVT